MNEDAVRVEGLWKEYSRNGTHGRVDTLRDLIAEGIKHPLQSIERIRARKESFWALQDVGFRAEEGRVLGLVGRNGAGKSTLLRVLSRVTEPTRGRIEIRGRVASLLEVGTGFHPDLTGRENVFLNGALLSMTRQEIRGRFDAIVAFAEIGAFIDTPVKRYSSGMYMRLAFSIAAHMETDILLVDEVLAVGDASFQQKCLGAMERYSEAGRTVIFVSHNMAAVTRLCHDALWIDGGRVRMVGRPRDVVGEYLNQGGTSELEWQPSKAGNTAFSYSRVRVETPHGESVGDEFRADRPIDIVFEYEVAGPMAPGRIALVLLNEEGLVVLGSASSDGGKTLDVPLKPGCWTLRCRIPGDLLAPGRYYVNISEPLADGRQAIHEGVLAFRVGKIDSIVRRDERPGVIAPILDWSETRMESGPKERGERA